MLAKTLENITSIFLIIILVVNLSQRRHIRYGEKKRFATLYFGSVIFVFWVMLILIQRYQLAEIFILPAAVLSLVLFFLLKNRIFIFSFRCKTCGKRLPWKEILYRDAPDCSGCRESKSDTEEV